MNNSRTDTMRARAWRLMRTIGNYTLTEIATLAEADYANISHYHQCLVKAGYARQVGTRKQEGRPGFDKVYRLVRNTGPKPPIQKSLRFLFDPNTKEYWADDPEIMANMPKPIAVPTVSGPGAPKPKPTPRVRLLCPRKRRQPNVD